MKNIGWIPTDHFPGSRYTNFGSIGTSVDMRISNVALWINEHSRDLCNELYDPQKQYDAVVFFKTYHPACVDEVKRIQAYGGKVIFDANTNVYKRWGQYVVPGTEPDDALMAHITSITRMADAVVADSSYLCEVIKEFNQKVIMIPDNVDLSTFRMKEYTRHHGPMRLVWSGISTKAYHLMHIYDVLVRLGNVTLTLVSEAKPPAMKKLEHALPCRYEQYSDAGYAQILAKSDIIISPKILNNAYAVGHSEYKITLGMAVGLPAVASSQQSYCEAINLYGGGFICRTDEEWYTALTALINDGALRKEKGALARKTVVEHYATDVVAKQYHDVLMQLFATKADVIPLKVM